MTMPARGAIPELTVEEVTKVVREAMQPRPRHGEYWVVEDRTAPKEEQRFVARFLKYRDNPGAWDSPRNHNWFIPEGDLRPIHVVDLGT